MEYKTFVPDPRLKPFVTGIWVVSGEDKMTQKVVSDGFPELIFHFGDTYEIRQEVRWISQSRALIAGQIDIPVYLQPTGFSGMIGVKFTATGLWKLFHWNMNLFRNEVIPLADVIQMASREMQDKLDSVNNNPERIRIVENFLLQRLSDAKTGKLLDHLIAGIVSVHGQVSVAVLAKQYQLSTRKLERLFNEQVGVSPKVYLRIIRFKYIYDLLQQSQVSTVEAAYLCGYFDQAHFNKDFKSFCDEDAKSYFTREHPFAQFLMSP